MRIRWPVLLAVTAAKLATVWALAAHAAEAPVVGPPAKPFVEMAHPAEPDYSRPSSWAARPETRDAADLVPARDRYGDRQARAKADVFYVHPTTYRGNDNWNQSLDDAATNAWTDASVIARQAAVFNACCRVYAPRYRQATAAAVYAPGPSVPQAYDLAYQDVKRAFLYYLERDNRGRPFLLAGHSQGTAHIVRLLAELGDRADVRGRLVAAYAVGIATPLGALPRELHGIALCRGPADTRCFVSWNAIGREGSGAQMVTRAQERYRATAGTSDGQEIVCVNPLTFDVAKPDAPAARNPGSLPATLREGPQAGKLPRTMPGLVGATCRDGILYTDIPRDPAFDLVVLPGQGLHFHDYDLFFDSIRRNAVERVGAFRR